MNQKRPSERLSLRVISSSDSSVTPAQELAAWRDVPAYLLLGSPGAGKSGSLRQEAQAVGTEVIDAESVIHDLIPASEVNGTVFIDGLDQVLGVSSTGHDALGAVARWLQRHGSPRFRLSCREVDWRGTGAQALLQRAAPDGHVTLLHLQPLSVADIRTRLRHWGVATPAAEAFMAGAVRQRLLDLLSNPLVLDLVIEATAGRKGTLPESRMQVYEWACHQLTRDESDEHVRRRVQRGERHDDILRTAGHLCAVMLLSGHNNVAIQGPPGIGELSLTEGAPPDGASALAALSTNLFQVTAGKAAPRHRTMAEFLAARELARLVLDRHVPLGRVRALMVGFDGRPVEALRGLFGWLASHLHGMARGQLLQIDPLAFILNGDANSLTFSERALVLTTLAEQADLNPQFRHGHWVEHPYGPLATEDMTDWISQRLEQADKSAAQLALVDCLFDALKHAPRPLKLMARRIEAWVLDASVPGFVRISALEAWKRHVAMARFSTQTREWLRAIAAGEVKDPDGRLRAALLTEAYPRIVQAEVLQHLMVKEEDDGYAALQSFWRLRFEACTPHQLLPVLADAWMVQFPQGIPTDAPHRVHRVGTWLLSQVLLRSGDQVTAERLHGWLGIGLSRVGTFPGNVAELKDVRAWLEARPTQMKAVAALAYGMARRDADGFRHFWLAEGRLRGAARPREWLRWQMQLAGHVDDAELALHLVRSVAGSVIDPLPGLEMPTMAQVEQWVAQIEPRLPGAQAELQKCWTSSVDDWRREDALSRRRFQAERRLRRAHRLEQFAPMLVDAPEGGVPPHLLDRIAMAHEGLFTDIEGEHPLARVEDLLGGSPSLVSAAMQAIDRTIDRTDLPSVKDGLTLLAQKKRHRLTMPLLLAAARACERKPDAWKTWTGFQVSSLVAAWLMSSTNETPDWYRQLCAHRPKRVAPVLVQHSLWEFRRKGVTSARGVWRLADEEDQQELVLLVLPALLEGFPIKSSESARQVLNAALLRLMPRLPARRARSIAHKRLAHASLDSGQRIAWLVALVGYSAKAIEPLSEWVGHNQRRVTILGDALYQQRMLERASGVLPTRVLRRMAELLIPVTPQFPNEPGGWVEDRHHRERVVHHLLELLSTDPTAEAAHSLQSLAAAPWVGNWRPVIERHLLGQVSRQREAGFQMATPEAVAEVLANKSPANHADLKALVADHLAEIGFELRHANTNQLAQFWTEAGVPKEENACRDGLLSRLEPRLRAHRVDIAPEAHAAASKRMDLKATYIDANGHRSTLPIEVKKDSYRTVWTAWRTQLQALYATDPDAKGHGLYLVLWFGHQSQRPPDANSPTTAAEFEALLRSRMGEEELRVLCPLVLDLSRSGKGQSRPAALQK